MLGLARVADDLVAADRATVGDGVDGGAVRVGLHRLHHAGDHVAGALDEHPVADPDVLAANVVLVVQRGHLHRRAADLDGFQDRVGVEAARPPDVDADVKQLGHPLRGRELVGHGPARIVGDDAEPLLHLERVDLDHHAVDAVVEVFFPLHP